MAESDAINLLRRSLGDTGDPQAWDDAALAQLLAENGGDHDRALAQGLLELMAQGARWHDYTTDVESESKSQVFDHLTTLHGIVTDRIRAAEIAVSGVSATRAGRSVSVKLIGGW